MVLTHLSSRAGPAYDGDDDEGEGEVAAASSAASSSSIRPRFGGGEPEEPGGLAVAVAEVVMIYIIYMCLLYSSEMWRR